MKARDGQAKKPNRRKRPTAAHRRTPSAADLQKQLDQRTRELADALEQQTATAEVLQVISSSPGDLTPVFNAMLENATRLCEAKFGVLFRSEGDALRAVALHDAPQPYAEERQRVPIIRPDPETMLGRALATKQPIQMADIRDEPDSSPSGTTGAKLAKLAGARTTLAVPMVKDKELVGVILIYRQEVRPFTNSQIELVTNFAKQAVIAIENTRLLNELRESLQQQTATSEVLGVISSSPGELVPVFQAMLANATRICEASFGNLLLYEGNEFRHVALHNAPQPWAAQQQRDPVPPRNLARVLYRVAETKQVAHVPDILVENPDEPIAKIARARTLLIVPMLKEAELIGVIAIYRQEVRPFNDKQIALLTSFARQAVIAIENTRLLNELRESLQQQTATADVLRVISSSPGKLEPVFEAILSNATHICEAKFGTLYLREGEVFRAAALHNAPPAYADMRRRGPVRPAPSTALSRMLKTKQVVHIPDITADQAYVERNPLMVTAVELGGFRTMLCVPMLKENEVLGAINIYRQEMQPFTDKQIALVTNFAAQAVIAIENTRLLNDLRESLQQQTATANVLKVISRSAFELQPIFDTLVENAVRLCEAERAFLFQFDGEVLRSAASYNVSPELREWVDRNPIAPGRHSISARAALERRTVHVPDVQADPEYAYAVRDEQPIRTTLAVPLLKGDDLVGTFTIYRLEVKPFTDKQIALVETFADQAVIAIENVRLFEEVQARTRDLSESLQQQTATADVLKVISSSLGELEPVFAAILANATQLCEAKFGLLFLYERDGLRTVAAHNVPPAFAEARKRAQIIHPGDANPLREVIRTKRMLHTADLALTRAYAERDPAAVDAVELGGIRTNIVVPMLKDNELVGVIGIFRQEVRPFNDKQIELVSNFGSQAVIAIENARLLNELHKRTDDLSEALEQQTATSDVLRVIGSSPSELRPVFQAMLENATRICAAKLGHMYRYDGEAFHVVAAFGIVPDYEEFVKREPIRVEGRKIAIAQLAQTKKAVQIEDMSESVAYSERDPVAVAAVKSGYRTVLAVPVLKESELIGAIVISRQEVRPFTAKQIELVTNFAQQAVIAIENARVLGELRESLQQQTATADVLKVISRSTFDLQTVLKTLVESAARLCEAESAFIWQRDGELFRLAANHGFSREFQEFMEQHPIAPGRGTVTGRALLEGTAIQSPDVLADPEYTLQEGQRIGGFRTLLGVPLLRVGTPIGVLALARNTVRPFADKQVELVTIFADQAVIAIENVRLLNELRESLQQQTATADVLKVISRSAFDLKSVLQTLVESAARLCEADKAAITRQIGGVFFFAEVYGFSPEFIEYVRTVPVKPERGTVTGVALLEGRIVHVPDVRLAADYTWAEAQRLGGFRTLLGVPMLREGTPIGVLGLARSEVRPFTEKQIELVQTFADQAAIAIENVRLFDEIQDKSRQLAEASQHKSQFLANMSHELRTPLNAILGYTELILDSVYGETPGKMRGVLERIESNGRHLLGLINAVLDLSKIEAGQLVLDLADYSLKNVVQTVNAALESLASEKKLALRTEISPALPQGRGDERRLTQVLLNLVGNAIKFTDAGEVVIKASATDGAFNLSVRDTGPGISVGDQTKLFQEFQQADNSITRKKGGTGLGLAISKRIIEMHGGKIWVDSVVGQGSTFSVSIPVAVKQQAMPA
jgi:GAF domain-containing protein